MTPQILTVVIEYHLEQNRVIVRGVFDSNKIPLIPLLAAENSQNHVKLFQGIVKGADGVGIKLID
jgi:hypothetical protein